MTRPKQLRKRHTLYAGELKALAEECGRSVSTLSRLISGERKSMKLARDVFNATGFWPEQITVSSKKRPSEKEAIAA